MDFSALHTYLEELADTIVPGLGLKVWVDHREVFSRAVGWADTEKKRPSSTDDVYLLWSMTKVVTAVAVLRLVEQGKLSLSDRLDRFYPEFSGLVVERDGKAEPAGRAPTIRELLTMTAGFTYQVGSENIRRFVGTDADTQTVIRALAAEPLAFAPGEHYLYSLCFDVLGAVVEAVSGVSFGEYLHREIFSPLEMADTGFRLTPAMRARRVPTFRMREDGSVAPTDARPVYQLSNAFEGGGAGLYSTLADYVKFADALACNGVAYNGYSVLGERLVTEMDRDQLNAVQRDDFHRATQHYGHGYGYGVSVLLEKEPYPFHCPLGVFGWGGAAGCRTFIDRERRVSLVYVQEVMAMQTRDGYMAHPHNRILNLVYDGLDK